jgi:hypothetical protein
VNWYKRSQSNYDHISDEHKGGDCFMDAFNYIFMHGVIGGNKNLQLVHAIICPLMGSLSGVEFGHSWVEDGDSIIDTSRKNQVMDKKTFYMLGGLINLPTFETMNEGMTIKEEKINRYSVEDAQRLAVKNKMYGPWEAKFDDFVLDNEEEDVTNQH